MGTVWRLCIRVCLLPTLCFSSDDISFFDTTVTELQYVSFGTAVAFHWAFEISNLLKPHMDVACILCSATVACRSQISSCFERFFFCYRTRLFLSTYSRVLLVRLCLVSTDHCNHQHCVVSTLQWHFLRD